LKAHAKNISRAHLRLGLSVITSRVRDESR
jgi:hypothetical protein